MTAGGSEPDLSAFQLEVARLFFALPASHGFATLDRFTDDEIPVPEGSSAAELRTFYATWRSELAR
jgi:hypothetical protein